MSTPKFVKVADCIYRNTDSNTLFERPYIEGKRTWLSLKTENLKLAKEELHRRKSAPRVREPEKEKVSLVTTGEVIRKYEADGYPDAHRQPRTGSMLINEQCSCKAMLPYWDTIPVNFTSAECDRYHDWRVKHLKKKGCTGNRSVDKELTTLSNAFVWAVRCELITANPVETRPTYCPDSEVKHCRDYTPTDANHLHQIARSFFEQGTRCETSGWQVLFDAQTGLRTCELLRLRMDAAPYTPGWVTPDGKSLCVGMMAGEGRAKGQHSANPFVHIHDGLRKTLDAHKRWHQERFPDSPWYFPGPQFPGKPAGKSTLIHALAKLSGKRVKPHGLRGFYVLVRRSNGISDVQIAYEIGHLSGGATVASVYGGCPAHWLAGEGPKMKWLPDGETAWRYFWPNDIIIQLPQAQVA